MQALTLRFRPLAPLMLGGTFVLLSLEVGRAFFNRGLSEALLLALLPAFVWLLANERLVFQGLLLVLCATLAFGRDFAYLHGQVPIIGRMYVLDLVLAALLLFGLPRILVAIRDFRPLSLIPIGIVLLTMAELTRRPITVEALRNSVIGLYSMWAIVGIAVVARHEISRLAKWLYAGAVVATAIYLPAGISPNNSFTQAVTPRLIPGAYTLYMGFAILLLLFAPGFFRSERARQWAFGLAVLQAGEIAISQVRSLWVALLVAILVTLAVGRHEAQTTRRITRFAVVLVALALLSIIAVPKTSTKIAATAHTIVAFNGPALPIAQTKADDTQWRLRHWKQTFDTFKQNPIFGIGFGVPVLDDSETRNAARAIGVPPPRIDPHNSFIAFLARFGLLGVALLLAFQIAVLRSGRRLLRGDSSTSVRQSAAWLLSCQLLTAVHACFTVVLEGPHMGLFYWLFGGMVIGLDRLRLHVREEDAADELSAL